MKFTHDIFFMMFSAGDQLNQIQRFCIDVSNMMIFHGQIYFNDHIGIVMTQLSMRANAIEVTESILMIDSFLSSFFYVTES